MVTPIVGAAFILTLTHYSPAQLSAMSAEQFQAYQIVEADTVKTPYLVIGGLFLAVAALIYFSKLPDITEREKQAGSTTKELRGILNYGHLLKGVLAQFFYVGAQVGVASFVIRFAQHIATGTPEKVAANYLKLHLLAFMIGRFVGTGLMRVITPARLLAAFSITNIVLMAVAIGSPGRLGLYALIASSFFMSIMFPTIFALGLRGLGES